MSPEGQSIEYVQCHDAVRQAADMLKGDVPQLGINVSEEQLLIKAVYWVASGHHHVLQLVSEAVKVKALFALSIDDLTTKR